MSYKESRHLALQKNLHLADEFKFFNFSAILASISSLRITPKSILFSKYTHICFKS